MAGRDPRYPTYPTDEEVAASLAQDNPKSGSVPIAWDMQDYCDQNPDDDVCDE